MRISLTRVFLSRTSACAALTRPYTPEATTVMSEASGVKQRSPALPVMNSMLLLSDSKGRTALVKTK